MTARTKPGGVFGICEPTHNMFFPDEESFRNWLIRICRYHPGDILYVRETFIFDDYEGFIDFRADFPACEARALSWQPSIHMPKRVARIFLRVTCVRVERLQEITADGAEKEGFTGHVYPQDFFAETWSEIYDERGCGWNANPWVWVIEFERCEKPQEDT